MQNNVKVAITGGIGSGKSTVCEIINELGYPVISCDEIYKALLKNTDFLKIIASEFGKDVLIDGKLDKARLSSIVFSNDAKLKKLNDITHPEIMKNLFNQAEEYKICFCEVPLLFEGGYEKDFEEVIVVLRDERDRIAGVVQRDNLSIESIKKRMYHQIDYESRDFAQYYVIHNDNDFSALSKNTQETIIDIISKYELL
ncbi:MAG: dephospho-CoA kinase [Clostridia bacterium]|nr:dephospho-CoA kinase [Clostridia bacterium]